LHKFLDGDHVLYWGYYILGRSEKVRPGLFRTRITKTQFSFFSQNQSHVVINFDGTFTLVKWCMQILHDSMDGGGRATLGAKAESNARLYGRGR